MRWRTAQCASSLSNAPAQYELRQRSRGGRWVRQRTVRVRQRTVEDDLVDSWHGHLEVRPRTCMLRWRHGRGVRQRIVACAGAPPLARLSPLRVEDHYAVRAAAAHLLVLEGLRGRRGHRTPPRQRQAGPCRDACQNRLCSTATVCLFKSSTTATTSSISWGKGRMC